MKKWALYTLIIILFCSISYAVQCGSKDYCTNTQSDAYCQENAVTRSIACLDSGTKIIEKMNWTAPCCKEDLQPYGGNLTMLVEGCGWDLTWKFHRYEDCPTGETCFEGACLQCSTTSNGACQHGCASVDPDCIDMDKDGYDSSIDCDENNNKIHPGADEICDGKDNNCDGLLPSNEIDLDKDGHYQCDDCDDYNKNIHPKNTNTKCSCPPSIEDENCTNNIDDDCDGDVDKGDAECSSAVEEAINTDRAPVAGFKIQTQELIANKPITFISTSTDDKAIKSHRWSMGDGANYETENVTHTYTNPGNYTITLSVTDTNGKVDPYTETITVKCIPECSSNQECNDNDASTTDVCVNAGECNSGCKNLNCRPRCISNGECDDNNASTTDKCIDIGKCTSQCKNEPANLELKVTSPDESTIYNAKRIILEYTTNKQSQCSYKVNNGNRISLFETSVWVEVKDGNNQIIIDCLDGAQKQSKQINFKVNIPKELKEPFLKRAWSGITNFFKKIRISMPSKEKKSSLLGEVFGSDEKLAQSELTEEHANIEKTALTEGNKSTVSININPDRVMYNVTVIEEIPKYLAENVSDVKFSNDNYEIIDEDPLLMWHFEELRENVELSYEVQGEVNEEDMPATVAVAEHISEEEIDNQITGSAVGAQEVSIVKIIAPLLAIPLIGLVLIVFNKFGKKLEERENKPHKQKVNDTLTRYVVNQIVIGAEKDEIKEKLQKKGWDEDTINNVFDDLEREI